MAPTSRLLLPSPDLSGCLFAAVMRDTRGVRLADEDRMNYFPASPLVSVTFLAEGELRLVSPGRGVAQAREAEPLPRLSVMPPQDEPTASWSPEAILAVSVGIYPDAWAILKDRIDVAAALERAFIDGAGSSSGWEGFCAALLPEWREARGTSALGGWSGLPRLADWSRALVARAALTGSGRSLRAAERRLRRWSGQTRQSLAFFAAFHDLHRLSANASDTPLAELALDAGYSDQSHMGRAVRRATGFSPARLNRLIETEEAFWCYRLLGERF